MKPFLIGLGLTLFTATFIAFYTHDFMQIPVTLFAYCCFEACMTLLKKSFKS